MRQITTPEAAAGYYVGALASIIALCWGGWLLANLGGGLVGLGVWCLAMLHLEYRS